MKKINIYYVAVVLLGMSLAYFLQPNTTSELSFYGLAESRETDINYNYPIVVDKILVSPGQEVNEGDTLMYLSRRLAKETLDDYNFEINKLKAEESIWKQKKQDELVLLEQNLLSKTLEINLRINQIENELSFNKSLIEDLENVNSSDSTYSPLLEKKELLESELTEILNSATLKKKSIAKQLRLGRSPYAIQIKKIKAKQTFDADQKVQPIFLLAPQKGLIGNISCKEEEHIPSFSSLMTFYEPHSEFIRGYVHEDLTLQVEMGDTFLVSSLKDEAVSYEGKVTGLGSRIVEIPPRLRKIEAFKTYGREILVEITKENSFLQKEKVGLTPVTTSNQ